MSDAALPPQPEIPQDDRTMATLAHVLQIVGWWIAPLVIFLVKRDSRFVKFHALQASFLQICLAALWIIGFIVFFAGMFASIPMSGSPPHNAPPPAMVYLFPIFWLLETAALLGLRSVVLGFVRPPVERVVSDGERLRFGDEMFEAIHTPGHTDDSVCYFGTGSMMVAFSSKDASPALPLIRYWIFRCLTTPGAGSPRLPGP